MPNEISHFQIFLMTLTGYKHSIYNHISDPLHVLVASCEHLYGCHYAVENGTTQDKDENCSVVNKDARTAVNVKPVTVVEEIWDLYFSRAPSTPEEPC